MKSIWNFIKAIPGRIVHLSAIAVIAISLNAARPLVPFFMSQPHWAIMIGGALAFFAGWTLRSASMGNLSGRTLGVVSGVLITGFALGYNFPNIPKVQGVGDLIIATGRFFQAIPMAAWNSLGLMHLDPISLPIDPDYPLRDAMTAFLFIASGVFGSYGRKGA